ncbi:NAD(P)-binding protein [Streptomyces sp. 3MP-14]|uniref:NAD(P)-binding protein n=1 Tax=Streptomyces mimosae TaxID=2586635 RepID=A0A5N6APB0_9ACTN|nr:MULTISPECIES: FAD-dependent monooxygenase [Streptomyces]KAB8169916.1 NAD(P)-binding protein [Streptomyces mimosae]KAB8178664.1 NAD(P)-binding protein [Streptomyces sp. 3MP-14]
MEEATDVCVVGGGPAGMALALLLLRSGVRVTVVESSPTLDREYRGEILQPGGLAVLDEIGVLKGAAARGSHPLARFRLVERGKTLMAFEYGRLRGPHNYLLSLPQAHLLAELRERCEELPGFRYLVARAGSLLEENGAVVGVTAKGADGSHTVTASCVVGADGRHSKIRRLANIEHQRHDIFDQDVVWFRLPAKRALGEVMVNRAGGNPMIAYDSHPDTLQLGWTLPKGEWKRLAPLGIDALRDRIEAAAPDVVTDVRAGIQSLADLSLLDVFGATAERWTADGLVLIGDAAHTHGPLGAQGINLALQDAVLLHPVLLAALREKDLSAGRLREFEDTRRPHIKAVMKFQTIQSRMMLSADGLATFLRPKLARVMMRTPIGAKVTDRVAFGAPGIRVADSLFTADRKE